MGYLLFGVSSFAGGFLVVEKGLSSVTFDILIRHHRRRHDYNGTEDGSEREEEQRDATYEVEIKGLIRYGHSSSRRTWLSRKLKLAWPGLTRDRDGA
jgi:hypothetical protein